jgi:hypothetical protein
MRWLALILILVVAVAVPAAGAGGRGRKTSTPAARCPQRQPRLVAANREAEVYEAEVEEGLATAVFGCVYGSSHVYRLGFDGSCGGGGEGGKCAGIWNETLAGTVVAFEKAQPHRIVVSDLRNGRILHSTLSEGLMEALVVKGDGAAAWVAQVGTNEGGYRVYSLVASGSKQLLASGSDIAPHSLALVGSTLYWTEGGKPFSAPLS